MEGRVHAEGPAVVHCDPARSTWWSCIERKDLWCVSGKIKKYAFTCWRERTINLCNQFMELYFCFVFETSPCYVAQAGFEFTIILS
jgi:hypothetical protein